MAVPPVVVALVVPLTDDEADAVVAELDTLLPEVDKVLDVLDELEALVDVVDTLLSETVPPSAISSLPGV